MSETLPPRLQRAVVPAHVFEILAGPTPSTDTEGDR